jgi:hypothetical protein
MNRAPLTQDAVDERLRQIGDLRILSGYVWEHEPSIAAFLLRNYRKKLIHNEQIDVDRETLKDVMINEKGRINPALVISMIDEFKEWAITVVRMEKSKL